MGVSGFSRLCLAIVPVIAVGCGGDRPLTAPPSSSLPASIAAVRIVGLPAALKQGETAPLTAEAVLHDGSTRNCEGPLWSASDPKVVNISSAGVLAGLQAGYVTISVVCEARSTSAETKVEALSPYRLVVVVQDAEVPNEFGVSATLQFLDGPRTGETVNVGWVYTNGLENIWWPVKVRVQAESYEPRDFILSESTGTRRNSTSPLFDFRIPLTFVPDGSTDTYVRRMTAAESEVAHPFTPRQPGTVRIRTWWSVDYNDRLHVDLWCGGALLRSATQLFGSAGSGFTHEVGSAGDCEVRLRQSKRDAHTHYRVAISYPH